MKNVTIKSICFDLVSLKMQVEIEFVDFRDDEREIWSEEFKAEVRKALEDTPWKEFQDYLDHSWQTINDTFFHYRRRWFVLIPVRDMRRW